MQNDSFIYNQQLGERRGTIFDRKNLQNTLSGDNNLIRAEDSLGVARLSTISLLYLPLPSGS